MDVDDFGDSHMFELRVAGAAWQGVDGDTRVTTSWREGEAARHRRREGPSGQVVEVRA